MVSAEKESAMMNAEKRIEREEISGGSGGRGGDEAGGTKGGGAGFGQKDDAAKTTTEGKESNNSDLKGEGRSGARTVPMWKLFSLADPFDYVLMTVGTIGAAANGAALPLMMLMFGELIDVFGHSQNSPTLQDEVSKVAVKFTYIGAAAAFTAFLEVNCWMMTGERQSARIRERYLKAILRQNVGFFDKDATTGEVMERMWGDTILIQDAIGEKVGSFLQLVVTFITGFAVAFSKGWELTLVMIAVMPLLVGSGAVMTNIIRRRASQGQDAYAEAGSLVDQVIGSIRTVASFVGEKNAVDQYSVKVEKAYKSGIVQGITNGAGMGSLMFILFCSYALCLWVGSRFAADASKNYTGGSVLSILFVVLIGSISLGQASPNLVAFASGRASAFEIFEIMGRDPTIDTSDMCGKTLPSIKGEIELRDVYFVYPARPDVVIFNGFSLTVPAGKMVALVGESGSGKSTVVSLIERFYDPISGDVCVDGVDIRSLQLRWWRQQIGLVSQEPVLFGTTIRENVAYGKEGATDREIIVACKMANAHRFINTLPKGYDTEVGDRGTQLSGGQKQRVAIARAILRNPRILLLDEATSALDTQSERIVQEALDRVMTDRTTIVVAHRLSTIRGADIITVVQRGRVVETGCHETLLSKPDGVYSALVQLQKVDEEEEVGETEGDQVGELRKAGGASAKTRPRLMIEEQDSMDINGSGMIVSTVAGDQSRDTARRRKWWRKETKSERDIEKADEGEGNADVRHGSMLRLAKLALPDLSYGVLGLIGSMANGAVFPVFSILLSRMLVDFYKPVEELKKGADFWSLIFVALAVWSLTAIGMQLSSFGVVGERLVKRIRRMVLEAVLRQEIGWFDDPKNSCGVIAARLSTDAAVVKSVVSSQLSLTTQAIVTVVTGLTIAFTASWHLAIVAVAIVPLLGAAGVIQARFIQGFSANAKVLYEKASKVANDAVSNIRTVAAFGAEEKVMVLYNERVREPIRTGKKQAIISGLGMGFAQFAMFNSYALCFWYGAQLVQDKKATFQQIFNVFFAVIMSARSVSHAQSAAPDLGKVSASIGSVFAILDRKSKIDPGDESGEIAEPFCGEIEFDQVQFSYPTRKDVIVLRSFSLKVPAGKILALVGESGSGKSTVVTLIERFYDPDAGRVLIDGKDARVLQLKWLRRQVGLVSQEPVLFATSIRDNIMYGRDNASEAEVEAAARAANAHAFVSKLPDGYDTLVGERGVQLSGGQKQRIAIARAVIKDPRVLLLDEATSALDAESERLVQEALDRIMVNRTTIVIAHRMTTIRNADKIVVMNGGVVIEQGRHEELAAVPGGAYANLVNLNKLSVR